MFSNIGHNQTDNGEFYPSFGKPYLGIYGFQTFKNRRYQWVQLAGHSGNFKAGKSQVKID
jgi:hypothetical protein